MNGMEHATSLLDVAPGETVEVDLVLFDTLRAHCAELGVRQGCRLTRLGGDVSNISLRGEDGTVVDCPARLARFIEVTRAGAQLPADGATSPSS
jgi:hypothetical protein